MWVGDLGEALLITSWTASVLSWDIPSQALDAGVDGNWQQQKLKGVAQAAVPQREIDEKEESGKLINKIYIAMRLFLTIIESDVSK